jgi:putative glutamine amidotransferase
MFTSWQTSAMVRPNDRPVIGMSCYVEPAAWGAWQLPAALVPAWYVELVQGAGGDVVILPPNNAPRVLDRLDGLVLIGGADIDARLYGGAPHVTADTPRESRDASEIGLYRRARERDMPVLGICRGLQMMAIAHGGSLIQHLPDLHTGVSHREHPGQFVEHQATFVAGTKVGDVYGAAPVRVNSSHHQAIDSPGSLHVTGRAEDGTIEACEDPNADFCVGIQWHPEHPDRRESDFALVRAFVDSASKFQSGQPRRTSVFTEA